MLENSFGVMFFLKTPEKKESLRVVYLRITVDGNKTCRKIYSSDIFISYLERLNGSSKLKTSLTVKESETMSLSSTS